MKKTILILAVIVLVAAAIFWFSAKRSERVDVALTHDEALEIANASACADEGDFTDTYSYNDFTKTWWFDMDIDKPGCAPACVVDEGTLTAEINWRCTGLIPEESGLQDVVRGLFLEKFGEDRIDTVTISQETPTHMRGDVMFQVDPATGQDAVGAYFLAAMVDGEWVLVADGNGQIDCELVESYGFPEDMITDCAR